MTAKELLMQCRQEKKEILILQEKKMQLEASLLPKALAIKPVNVMDSADDDPMFHRLPEVVDLEQQIKARLKEMYENEQKAYEMVWQIKDSKHRQLLQLYYLQFQVNENGRLSLHTWESVAETMNYSIQWVYELRDEALKSITE